MGNVILLPVIIPFTTAVLCLAALAHPRLQTLIGIAGAAALFGAGILLVARVIDASVLTLQVGDWPAPYGITFAADYFSAGMVLLTGFIGLAAACYSAADIDTPRKSFGYFSVFHFMLTGLCGAFLTGDLFNFYVWFEVTLTASFVLISLGGMKAQLRGAINYLTINLAASAFLLAGIGLLYGQAGTLNMADLAWRFSTREGGFSSSGTAALFFVAFGIKAAIFPLFFWLPAAYHTPPAAVRALFAGLLTKLGLYGMIRTFTLLFFQPEGFSQTLVLAAAGATMITGAFGALSQTQLNRLLSFSIVSQMGYILMGLGLFSRLALAGAFFFILHESIVKTSLFLIFGIICRRRGELDIRRLGGILNESPYLSACFLIAGLSLAGLPPLSGFLAKYALVRAGLSEGRFIITGIALTVAVLTLLYVMRIWQEAFWKPPDQAPVRRTEAVSPFLLVPAGGLAVMSLLLGIFGGPVIKFCLTAGDQLMNPSGYIHAVLGKMP